jgi:hypothetical protein
MALPAQILRAPDSSAWTSKLTAPRAVLSQADSAIERELRSRNLFSNWVFPAELIRSARRNPTYAVDPTQIRAAEAVHALERKPQSRLAEPVASQLRALAGLHDARYALVPVEVRLELMANGTGRAMVHLALIDVRAAHLDWSGDVAGEPAATPPAAFAALALKVVDLVAAR